MTRHYNSHMTAVIAHDLLNIAAAAAAAGEVFDIQRCLPNMALPL